MKTWFICKVKYPKQTDEGIIKSVKESYLIDAQTYTEAEARCYEQMGKEIGGVFEIVSITKTKFTEVLDFQESAPWFQCKMTYISVNEDEKAKKITNLVLINADNIEEANSRLKEALESMMVPFEVPSITQTSIIQIFPYYPEEEEEENVGTLGLKSDTVITAARKKQEEKNIAQTGLS